MLIPNRRYLIIDLEATCSDDDTVPRNEMEIIEIGAVMQDAKTFEIESEFQTFVRPVRHPKLTEFCTQLTTIEQADVDDAPDYVTAIDAIKKWMFEFEDALFCSWGDYDRKQFVQDCEFHDVAFPFRSEHLNLKAEFSRAINSRRRYGLAGAIKYLQLTFEGTHHRGIDDVRNIARIVRHVGGSVH